MVILRKVKPYQILELYTFQMTFLIHTVYSICMAASSKNNKIILQDTIRLPETKKGFTHMLKLGNRMWIELMPFIFHRAAS